MKISIVMASYNYAPIIGEAIESIINQTYKDWELIIVDDGSTDNSVEVIKKYLSDNRIKLYINEKNLGLAKTVRKGIQYSTSDWIAFLESDDKFFPNALEEKVKAISTDADIIFSDLELFGDKECIIHLQKHFDNLNNFIVNLKKSGFIENFAKILPKINVIPTFSVVMTKKELLAKCDFNPLCKSTLDYYLWAQLACYKVYYINKKLSYWSMHKDSYINRDKYCWLKKYLFNVSIYAYTIKNKNKLIKPFLIMNYMRARLIYLKLDKKSIKLNLLNHRFIFEKKFK